jgi:hypothetical protein
VDHGDGASAISDEEVAALAFRLRFVGVDACARSRDTRGAVDQAALLLSARVELEVIRVRPGRLGTDGGAGGKGESGKGGAHARGGRVEFPPLTPPSGRWFRSTLLQFKHACQPH